MPTDFRDMASKLRAEHEKDEAAEKAKRDTEANARTSAVDTAVHLLKSTVLPILERAKAEIATEGIEARVTTNFDAKNRLDAEPSITFQCFGPPRKRDGFQFKAAPVFFSCEGDDIKIGMGKEGYDTSPKLSLGSARPGQTETVISTAVRRAVESYFQELKKHKDSSAL